MEYEIREKLDSYLRGDLSIEAFREWLITRTWNQQDAPDVAHAIAYHLDEAASGRGREHLDVELRRLAASYSLREAARS